MGRAPRSYLYVPGDEPGKLDGATRYPADVLVVDLEDAVPRASKESARALVAEILRRPEPRSRWWVRINAEHPELDIAAVACTGLAGVVVPKAEPDLLARVATALARAERDHGLPDESLEVLPLVETARGLLTLERSAEAARVVRLGLGEADLAAELGIQPGPHREELWPQRAQVVLVSAAARLLAPVGPVETAVHDLKLLSQTTQTLLRQGFRARTAIHPGQLDVINDVFTPTPAQVREARDVVERYEAAKAEGSGLAVTDEGRLLDAAVVRSAREVLGRQR